MNEVNTKNSLKNDIHVVNQIKEFMTKEIVGNIKYIIFSCICMISIKLVYLVPPLIMKKIIDVYIPSKDLKNIYLSIILLCGLPFVTTAINIFFNYKNIVTSRNISHKLKRKIFFNLMNQPLSFFDKSKTGELASACGKDVYEFIYFFMNDIPSLCCDIITSIIIVILLFKISISITIIQFISIPIILIPISKMSKKMGHFVQIMRSYNDSEAHIVTESFIGIKFIKSNILEFTRIEMVKKIQDNISKIWGKIVAYERLYGDWAQQFVFAIFTGLSFAACAVQAINGKLSTGSLIAYMAYLPQFQNIILKFTSMDFRFKKQFAEHEKTFRYLCMTDEYSMHPSKQSININKSPYGITFKNVSFSYLDSNNYILQNISFNIKHGEFVGIIGQSGAGKSTLFDLILKFYKPQKGSIFLAGIDIWDIDTNFIRKNITLVSQDTFLFAGTLRYNLQIVNPDATEEDLLEALHMANLTTLLKSLPNGLDTDIGDRGEKLSGGEKQRIAIARAILRESKILLLDEVTSNVDITLESQILSSIDKIIKSRNMTIISIAHRISFLKGASRIIEIKDGCVCREGTFNDFFR